MRQTTTAIMDGVADVQSHKRIANNTVRYERSNGDIVYRLHNTDIVTKHPDGTFTLNSGGWKTPTTKDRINTYAPAHLYSNKGMWYVGRVPFFDGMKIASDGNVMDWDENDGIAMARDASALKSKITKFVRLVDDCETLPVPDSGDCWFCMMFNAEPARDTANQMNPGASGPAMDAGDHLLSHMDEGYLHGSLLVNAMRWAGYQDTAISLWYGRAQCPGRGSREIFKRTLRRYLKRKLGLV